MKQTQAKPGSSNAIVLEAVQLGERREVMIGFGTSGKSTLAADAINLALSMAGKSAKVGTVVFQDPDSGEHFVLNVHVDDQRGAYLKYMHLVDSLGAAKSKARIVRDDKGVHLTWEDETKEHPHTPCIAPRFQIPSDGGTFKASKFDWVAILPDGRIVPLLDVLGDRFLWNFRGENANGTMRIFDDAATFLYTLLVTRKRRNNRIVVTMSLRAPSQEGGDKLGKEMPIGKSVIDQRRWMFAVVESYDNGKTWVLSDANFFNGKPKKRCDACEGVTDEKKLCLVCRFGPFRLPNHDFEDASNTSGERKHRKEGRKGGGGKVRRQKTGGGQRSPRSVYTTDDTPAPGSGTMAAALRDAKLVDAEGKVTLPVTSDGDGSPAVAEAAESAES